MATSLSTEAKPAWTQDEAATNAPKDGATAEEAVANKDDKEKADGNKDSSDNKEKPEVTPEMVQKARRKQRKAITFQVLTVAFSFIFGFFYFIFYSKSRETCESEPMKMKSVFLWYGLLHMLNIALTMVILISTTVFLDEHYLKQHLYKDMGRPNAAEKEGIRLHREPLYRFLVAIGFVGGAGSCGVSIVTILLTFAAFASVMNAGNEDNELLCDDEVSWFWFMIVANMFYSCAQTAWTTLAQPAQSSMKLPGMKKAAQPAQDSA